MIKFISILSILCFLATVLQSEENKNETLQLDRDIKYMRTDFRQTLTIPGAADRARVFEVLFSKGGDVTITLDGVSESFKSYDGIRTGLSTSQGVNNIYTVAVLGDIILTLNKVIKEQESSFERETKGMTKKYKFYGQSLGVRTSYAEEVSYTHEGISVIISGIDLHGPSLDRTRYGFNKDRVKEEQTDVFMTLNGAMSVIDDITRSISEKYDTNSTRPSFRDLLRRESQKD